ncbi:hypothetical protein OPU71_18155 [Niveibacterium sp. 24ML]|uniref:hypothetical protein n=1 Tax=Niveibacterium sp. 24ML TaxID=2985512 RepID=UPI002270456C|nr:hypothetical protein [Niveibacterium sp. 24ML]MCX9158049.1 hypothetical protein [Niveibacterium sp. 24ML]
MAVLAMLLPGKESFAVTKAMMKTGLLRGVAAPVLEFEPTPLPVHPFFALLEPRRNGLKNSFWSKK